jgi:hypothetical protein
MNEIISAAAMPQVIAPLIERHAQDAAFYWSQIDQSAGAANLSLARLNHFEQLLDAHLEGLQVAGPPAAERAWAALARWRKPGEAFVCTWLAARLDDVPLLGQVMGLVGKQPDLLLRGAISAIGWLPQHIALALIRHWSAADAAPVHAVAALRGAALLGPPGVAALAQPLPAWISHADARVRASACRAARALAWQLPAQAAAAAVRKALAALLRDEDAAVRAEASIALGVSQDAPEVPGVLWKCVLSQIEHAEQATGWYRMQAQRRLQRWARHLACVVPHGHEHITALYDYLPPRMGLAFALHHGDAAHLLYVVGQMDSADDARYAGWVWQTLTGIDLAERGMVMPPPDPASIDWRQPLSQGQLDADFGLPMPDAAAVHSATAMLPPMVKGQRLLLGQGALPMTLLAVLESAPQALRAVAAHALWYLVPQQPVSVRAPMWRQAAQVAALKQLLA